MNVTNCKEYNNLIRVQLLQEKANLLISCIKRASRIVIFSCCASKELAEDLMPSLVQECSLVRADKELEIDPKSKLALYTKGESEQILLMPQNLQIKPYLLITSMVGNEAFLQPNYQLKNNQLCRSTIYFKRKTQNKRCEMEINLKMSKIIKYQLTNRMKNSILQVQYINFVFLSYLSYQAFSEQFQPNIIAILPLNFTFTVGNYQQCNLTDLIPSQQMNCID